MNTVKRQLDLIALQRFTLIEFASLSQAISRASDSEIQTHKDAARDFVRFVRCAHVIELVQTGFEFEPKSIQTDPDRLVRELAELETLAHPRSGRPCSESTGPIGLDQRLAAIDENLSLLAGLMRQHLIP